MPGKLPLTGGMPDPAKIIRDSIKCGVDQGLSGREASRLVLGIVTETRKAAYLAVCGHDASTDQILLWFTDLLNAAGNAAIANNKT